MQNKKTKLALSPLVGEGWGGGGKEIVVVKQHKRCYFLRNSNLIPVKSNVKAYGRKNP